MIPIQSMKTPRVTVNDVTLPLVDAAELVRLLTPPDPLEVFAEVAVPGVLQELPLT